MTYMRVSIPKRGFIPVIKKQGPQTDICLWKEAINELCERGVMVTTLDGTPIFHVEEIDGKLVPVDVEVKFSTRNEPPKVKGEIDEKVQVLKDQFALKDRIKSDPTPMTGMEPVTTDAPQVQEAASEVTETSDEKAAEPAPPANGTSENKDQYAGMSKNQIKKAKRAAAEAAAEKANAVDSAAKE